MTSSSFRCDLEYDPSDYVALLEPLVTGRADVVYGSRFKRPVRGMRWPNRVANVLLTHTANLLFHASITDEATAYKAFRADLLRALTLTCRRFEFCPEVTAKLLRIGITIHEVPVRYEPRTTEQGKKIRWSDGVAALWTLLRFRMAPVSWFYDRAGTGMPAGPRLSADGVRRRRALRALRS